MRSAYVTATRIAELRQRLTPEEWALLHHVGAMRLAVARDLQALRALDGPLSVRSFRRLLLRLTELGVLARLGDRSVGGRAAGSAGFVYIVGPAGIRLLAPGSSSKRLWAPRPAWLNHALAVSHLYVQLRQLELTTGLKLQTFAAEPLCWRGFPGMFAERQTLKPDAHVVTTVGSYQFARFIEVDCGTESPATLARKLTVYYRYFQSGIEQHRTGLFPEVLWLVPSERRRAVLADVVSRQPPEGRQLHRVVRYDQAAGVFSEEPP